jgi:hypothetical protein
MKEDSFLQIDNLNEENKDRLLQMRKILFEDLIRNAKKEERKGMYLVSLAVFSEFERLTKHITNSDITKH